MIRDTDSLTYRTKTKDIYENLHKESGLFDFSDYPQDSKIFDPVDKKVIGKMEDEFKRKIIPEFVELKSRMYSVIDVKGKENKKRKGVNSVVAKNVRHKKYRDNLINKKMMRHIMKRIQSKLHRIRTYEVCKIYLSCSDDKRYILDDGINSLAYFHKDILKNKSD